MNEEQLYDVIIYEKKTGIIDAIVGERMKMSTGFYNADKRLETALGLINDAFDAEIVKTGKYKKGDIYEGDYER